MSDKPQWRALGETERAGWPICAPVAPENNPSPMRWQSDEKLHRYVLQFWHPEKREWLDVPVVELTP